MKYLSEHSHNIQTRHSYIRLNYLDPFIQILPSIPFKLSTTSIPAFFGAPTHSSSKEWHYAYAYQNKAKSTQFRRIFKFPKFPNFLQKLSWNNGKLEKQPKLIFLWLSLVIDKCFWFKPIWWSALITNDIESVLMYPKLTVELKNGGTQPAHSQCMNAVWQAISIF